MRASIESRLSSREGRDARFAFGAALLACGEGLDAWPFRPAFSTNCAAASRLPIWSAGGCGSSGAGASIRGLCPFHNEKTPSFYVVEDKGFFHCFGCGAHGDAIGFVMRADNLDFIEAVERLAGEAGIAVPQQTPQERERAQRQKTLLEALAAAAEFYEAQLWGPAGARARDI